MNIFLSWHLEADHFHHPSTTAPVQSIILALLNPWTLPTCLPVRALPLLLSILCRAAAVQAPYLWVPPALLSNLIAALYLTQDGLPATMSHWHHLFLSPKFTSSRRPAVSTIRSLLWWWSGHCTLLSYPPVSFTDLTRSEVTLLMDRPRGPCSPLPLESQHLDCGDSLCLFCCHVLTMLNFIWCLWSWKTQKAKISTLSPSFVFDKWFACREPSFPKMT